MVSTILVLALWYFNRQKALGMLWAPLMSLNLWSKLLKPQVLFLTLSTGMANCAFSFFTSRHFSHSRTVPQDLSVLCKTYCIKCPPILETACSLELCCLDSTKMLPRPLSDPPKTTVLFEDLTQHFKVSDKHNLWMYQISNEVGE